jgi:mRNA interferase RelE/StbE
VWTIRIEKRATRDPSKLSKSDQRRILEFLELRLAPRDDPRELGAALTGLFVWLWKYRVGDFRILAKIEDRTVEILVVQIGNRREVYR